MIGLRCCVGETAAGDTAIGKGLRPDGEVPLTRHNSSELATGKELVTEEALLLPQQTIAGDAAASLAIRRALLSIESVHVIPADSEVLGASGLVSLEEVLPLSEQTTVREASR